MTFDGFYDNKWWWGRFSSTREFRFGETPDEAVNVFAFGALTAVEVSKGQFGGIAYVGILEAIIIDPNTGMPISTSTQIPDQYYPSPNFTARVLSITWAFGSEITSSLVDRIEYANASLNMLLWS